MAIVGAWARASRLCHNGLSAPETVCSEIQRLLSCRKT
jgi:hypothetical protein